METINISIYEQREGQQELGHPVTLPIHLVPSIGDEFYLPAVSVESALLITGKRITILDDGNYHIALKAARVDI